MSSGDRRTGDDSRARRRLQHAAEAPIHINCSSLSGTPSFVTKARPSASTQQRRRAPLPGAESPDARLGRQRGRQRPSNRRAFPPARRARQRPQQREQRRFFAVAARDETGDADALVERAASSNSRVTRLRRRASASFSSSRSPRWRAPGQRKGLRPTSDGRKAPACRSRRTSEGCGGGISVRLGSRTLPARAARRRRRDRTP